MTDKAHSLVNEGSRHAIHDLTYPNAANRIAGTNEGKGYNPPGANKLWHVAKQDDDDSYWIVVDIAPLTWVQVATSTTADLDFGYDNFGANPSTITVDAAEGQTGGLTFALDGVRNLNIDLTSSDDPLGGEGGTYYGLYVNNGTDNFQVVRSAANQVGVRGTLNDFIIDGSGRVEFNIAEDFEVQLTQDLASGNFVGFVNNGTSGLSAASGIQNWLDLVPRIEQSGTAAYNAIRVNLTEASTGSGDTNLLKMIVGGSTQFQVASDGNTKIGTGTPGFATGAADLFVTGDIEASTIEGGGFQVENNGVFAGLDPAGLGAIRFRNTVQTPDTMTLEVGSLTNHIVVCQYADAGYDFAHTLQTNPTLFFQSANQSATEWGSLAHDQTHFRINTGAGAVCIGTGTPAVATGIGSLYITGVAETSIRYWADNTETLDLSNANHTGECLFVRSTGLGAGDGNPTGLIAFGKHDGVNSRAAAGISGIQTDPDPDKVGLIFYTSPSSASTQTLTEAMRVTHEGNVRIGTGTPSYATGSGELFVSGDAECSSLFSTGGVKLATSQILEHTTQNGTLPEIMLGNGTQAPSTTTLGTGTNANSWIICEGADAFYNFAHGLEPDPTLFFQSANQSLTEWGSLAHDQTHFRINTGAGAVCIGTGTPGVATGLGALYVTDDLEVSESFYLKDDKPIVLGNVGYTQIKFNTAQTPDTLTVGLGSISNSIIFAELGDLAFDFAHGLQTDPTIFVQSSSQSLTEWGSLAHDQTHFRINTGAGAVAIGAGTPGVATGVGDLYVTGKGEFDDSVQLADGKSYFVGGQDSTIGHINGTTEGGFRFRSLSQTPNSNLIMTGSRSNAYILCEYDDAGYDFAHAQATSPTLFIQSENQVTDEYATLAWNDLSIGGGKGAFAGLKSITEELTIPVGQGAAGVATAGNLAPANADIRSTAIRVTQAPGGGATTIDVGVTGSGNVDELIDGVSTAATTTGTSQANNDGTQLPLQNGSATTLTLTTDANVTGTDMKVRIVTFYEDFTPPTA